MIAMKKPLALVVLTICPLLTSRAAGPAPDPAGKADEMGRVAAGITYRQGPAILGDGLARISVPEQFRFVDSNDTEAILSRLWGNPKGSHALGSLVPAGFNPLGDASWMVIITYSEDGHVKDDDAAQIDYSKLLTEIQKAVREKNPEREKQGYKPIELVGWAKPPRYDPSTHKLYWAKELNFGGTQVHTLNYNIRMLGRRGVLVLNAVAAMPQLPDVEAATPAILAMVDFQPGNRYSDFEAGTDKVATYGLAALVAGGVAAKAGLLKLLWVGILAFKKLIIVGVIALFASFKKLMAWIRGRDVAETIPPPPVS